VAAFAAAQPQKAVGQDAALRDGVELVLDEPGRRRSGAGFRMGDEAGRVAAAPGGTASSARGGGARSEAGRHPGPVGTAGQ